MLQFSSSTSALVENLVVQPIENKNRLGFVYIFRITQFYWYQKFFVSKKFVFENMRSSDPMCFQCQRLEFDIHFALSVLIYATKMSTFCNINFMHFICLCIILCIILIVCFKKNEAIHAIHVYIGTKLLESKELIKFLANFYVSTNRANSSRTELRKTNIPVIQ